MVDESWGETEEYQRLLEGTSDARRAYFRTLGEPEDDIWSPIVNPVLHGGPAWPTRPGWQRIHTPSQTIIASCGLSDPWDDADGPNLGFGIETAVATADETPYNLRQSWLMELATLLSQEAAEDGQFHLRHAQFGTFLFGVRGEFVELGDWADDDGYLGLLVSVPAPGISTAIALPTGVATLLMAKLLTPAEYSFVAARGPDGAQELVARFAEDGTHHLSSLGRRSVV